MTASQLILALSAAAVISDLRTGRISNHICAAGFICGFVLHVICAFCAGSCFPDFIVKMFLTLAVCLAGAAIPFALGYPLFRLRMFGAGDIKLLMAVGWLAGPAGILKFMAVTCAFGGLISALIMVFVTGIRPRVRYFLTYILTAEMSGAVLPYRDDPSAEFHFTIPVFMTALVCAAGFI